MAVAYVVLVVAFILGGATVWLIISGLTWVVYGGVILFLTLIAVSDWSDRNPKPDSTIEQTKDIFPD